MHKIFLYIYEKDHTFRGITYTFSEKEEEKLHV